MKYLFCSVILQLCPFVPLYIKPLFHKIKTKRSDQNLIKHILNFKQIKLSNFITYPKGFLQTSLIGHKSIHVFTSLHTTVVIPPDIFFDLFSYVS